MKETTRGTLRATVTTTDSPDEAVGSGYDLAIVTPSWDRRADELAKVDRRIATRLVLLVFDERDDDGLRDLSEQRLSKWAESVGMPVTRVTGSAVDLEGCWEKLLRELEDEVRRNAGPVRVFFDMTACPRFYSLGILATALKYGLAESVTMFYSEGEYPEKSGASEVKLTKGEWRAVPIPGIEGTAEPDLPWHLTAALGFEGEKLLRLASLLDPDRMSVIVPDPGTREGYVERVMSDNKDLLNEFLIPESQILRCEAGDAVAVWETLADRQESQERRENHIFVSAGTKAHALGLAIRALELRSATVLYNLPEAFEVIAISPTGVYRAFEISRTTTRYRKQVTQDAT